LKAHIPSQSNRKTFGVCQRGHSGAEAGLTSNLERNSSIAALSPDRNWGFVAIVISRCVKVSDKS
jgi:hypothetical protein